LVPLISSSTQDERLSLSPYQLLFWSGAKQSAHSSSSAALISSICQRSCPGWPCGEEPSHAVNEVRRVSCKPGCHALSTLITSAPSGWPCRCLSRVAWGWDASAPAQRLADSLFRPLLSHPWQLERGLAWPLDWCQNTGSIACFVRPSNVIVPNCSLVWRTTAAPWEQFMRSFKNNWQQMQTQRGCCESVNDKLFENCWLWCSLSLFLSSSYLVYVHATLTQILIISAFFPAVRDAQVFGGRIVMWASRSWKVSADCEYHYTNVHHQRRSTTLYWVLN